MTDAFDCGSLTSQFPPIEKGVFSDIIEEIIGIGSQNWITVLPVVSDIITYKPIAGGTDGLSVSGCRHVSGSESGTTIQDEGAWDRPRCSSHGGRKTRIIERDDAASVFEVLRCKVHDIRNGRWVGITDVQNLRF